jgi:hypothetical protein
VFFEDVSQRVLRLVAIEMATYGCGSAPDSDRLPPTTDVMGVDAPDGAARH